MRNGIYGISSVETPLKLIEYLGLLLEYLTDILAQLQFSFLRKTHKGLFINDFHRDEGGDPFKVELLCQSKILENGKRRDLWAVSNEFKNVFTIHLMRFKSRNFE